MCDSERLAYFYFWREVGRRMEIKDIPADYAEFETFNRNYESRHYRFTEANRRVGTATRELFVGWFPRFCAPLVRRAIHSLLDDSLIEAFGFPPPSPMMRRLVPGAVRLRGKVAGWLPAPPPPAFAHGNGASKLSEGLCHRRVGAAGGPIARIIRGEAVDRRATLPEQRQ
jgi:hypothetical protein